MDGPVVTQFGHNLEAGVPADTSLPDWTYDQPFTLDNYLDLSLEAELIYQGLRYPYPQ